jgi:predicted outer membrane protein
MKKYSEYLNEQYTPLTRDELTKLCEIGADFDPKYLREYATAHQHESDDLVIKSALSDALDEIDFLREQLAVAYEYIGRRAPNPAPAKYRAVMHHATRIRKEERGVKA